MAEAPESQLGNVIVVVNDEPYCVWGVDLDERNREFLNGLDPEYFSFLIDAFIEREDEKRASVALRTTMHHGLETLFSLLGAYLQSPACAYCWLPKCSTGTLRKLVQRISAEDADLFTVWKLPRPSWRGLSGLVFDRYLPGTEKGTQTAELFGKLWERLAHEFIDGDHIDEYNSIKHGMRVRAGGFTLQAGTEHVYGQPLPSSEMQTVGHSEFGTSFFRIERIGPETNRNFSSRRVNLNWRIERVVTLAQLVAMSIQNVIAALRIANSNLASSEKFWRPSEDGDFDKPWSFSTGTTKMSMDFVFESDHIPAVSREQLVEWMKSTTNQRAQLDSALPPATSSNPSPAIPSPGP